MIISIKIRFLISYLIILAANHVAFLSMKAAHTNNPASIAWSFVSGLHSLLLWGAFWACVVLLVGFVALVDWTPFKKVEPPVPQVDPEVVNSLKREIESQRQKTAEAERQVQRLKVFLDDERQNREKAERKSRSAEEAAQSALDDF